MLISSHELTEIESLATHLAYIDRGPSCFRNAADLQNRVRSVRVTLMTGDVGAS
jgi:ABC-type multidrug transport system ATPase subunit